MTAVARGSALSETSTDRARDGERSLPTGARLVATGITKSYADNHVLRGLDVALPQASLVAVAGRNGAGKSTLLACLAGTIRHSGRVLLDGRPVGAATRGRVAYLPQRMRLPGNASVGEVLALFRSLAGSQPQRVALPDGFLPPANKPVGQLSGGQAQRVALAATLAGSPDLLLLDEPFANLDDAAREQTRTLLREHRDAGATVLIASPTAMDLLAMIDRVLVVEDGGIAFDGSPARYAGRLEMTIWVRPGDVPHERLATLPHVLRVRDEGDWMALECHDDRAIGLVAELGALGIPADRVRLGGPADARLSASPERPRGEDPT